MELPGLVPQTHVQEVVVRGVKQEGEKEAPHHTRGAI